VRPGGDDGGFVGGQFGGGDMPVAVGADGLASLGAHFHIRHCEDCCDERDGQHDAEDCHCVLAAVYPGADRRQIQPGSQWPGLCLLCPCGAPPRSVSMPSVTRSTRSAPAGCSLLWLMISTVWLYWRAARISSSMTSRLLRRSRLPVGSSAKISAG